MKLAPVGAIESVVDWPIADQLQRLLRRGKEFSERSCEATNSGQPT